MTKRGERSRCVAVAAAGAAACFLAAAPGCNRPVVGPPTTGAQSAGGPLIRIAGATIDGTGHVVASLEILDGGAPVGSVDAARALKPAFTLAALSTHPVDGLAAWKSLLLTGAQTIPSLPPAGTATPPGEILTNARQPGAESAGTLAGKDGAFTYTFANALPSGFDPAQTVRVGVWLLDLGTEEGTSTFDFRPAGGAPAPRDTVLDENCKQCHARVVSPWGAVGVKICLTCHTWQHADPDTVDPAALYGSTAATSPNPLELGRMVHLIHRGKWIPVLYQAAAGSGVAPALPSATVPPLPFLSSRTSGTTAANPPVVGRKYAIVGKQSRERVFARVVERRDNNQPAKVAVAGVLFPRDLRACGACHARAPQEYEVVYAISRRTCWGCHPEVWFAPPNADGTSSIAEAAPAVHFAHTGGPQADDTGCAGCHVAATPAHPKVYAPIAEAHQVPREHRASSKPWFEIVSVTGLVPGGAPTVRFKVKDRVGTISPINAPTPANDTGTPASPVPRRLDSLRIAFQGPTFPDYEGIPVQSSDPGNPSPLTLVADADGAFTYTFASKVPAWARGTWSVSLEGRRRIATTFYDVANDRFVWPYTGETLGESADNVLAYVDTSAGTWPGGGSPAPRRRVVSQQKCLRCHLRFESHGGNRHEIEECLTCHTPDRTDWERRPKWAAGTPLAGNVNLGATFDAIEERSIQLKVVIHRIHTGGRKGGSAVLELPAVSPYAGNGTSASYREGIFPSDLANCTSCHEGTSYRVESVPAGAAPNRANESGTIWHEAEGLHVEGEPVTPAITAACVGCHATGSAWLTAYHHVEDGVEQCAQCHVRGALSMDVAHGLATVGASQVSSSFADIAEKILVPRCATAACHGGSPPAAFPRLDAAAAWEQLVGPASQQVSMALVEPYDPAKSYLILKIRNEAGVVGGIATPMPIGDALLDPSDVAAIEAWIANGAPND